MNTSCTRCRIRTSGQRHDSEAASIQRLGEILDRDTLDVDHWFDRALMNDAFSFHFQPIVDVRRDRVHGHECLVRLSAEDNRYGSDEILEAAIGRHHVHVFDSYCRQKAIGAAALYALPGTKVFINFLPAAIYDPTCCLQSTLDALGRTALRPADLVFEVVDSEQVHRLSHLLPIREFLRDQGFGFALDDAGTGQSTLNLVKQFRPEYIKLGLPNANFAEIAKLQDVATWWGAKIIAEGVEEPAQADALQEAGIDLMQGWLFGRPAPEMINGPAIFAGRAV